jgi:predicted amidohydrolase
MVLDPYGRVVAESSKADDDMVVADLDATLLDRATGRLWIKARRPSLYGELAVETGLERDVHELKREE